MSVPALRDSKTVIGGLAALALLITLFMPVAARQAAPASASAVDPALFAGLRWRSVGPFVGGRVTAVAGHRAQLTTFYMGATGGGVWKTTNAGETWTNISDGFFETASIGAIEVAESDPSVIYVGTGSLAIRSNVIEGRGLYKSTDAGRTWTYAGLRDAGQIGSIRVHPKNANLVYAAALGTAFGANETRGIFRSTDGAKTWTKVLYVNDRTGGANLAMNPANPSEIYATMWRGERKPWTIISGGPATEGGIYKTTDGGDKWIRLANGLPQRLIGKIDVDVARSQPSTVYALIEAPGPEGGLYRSDDAGGTWKMVSNPNDSPRLLARPFYYTYVDVDPKNADTVWVNNLSLLKSADGGRTWRNISTPHGDNHGMWINPDDPNYIIQSNDGGANVSIDGGETWSTQENQPTAELYAVEVDNQFPYRLYGAQQDNNTWIVLSRLPHPGGRGSQTATYRSGPGCETGPIRPKPDDPNIVYGVCKGEFYRMNLTTGQTQSNWVYPQNRYGYNNPARDIRYRFQRTSPFMVSKHDPNLIYHGSHVLHRSSDGGLTWEIISGDLTANLPDGQATSGEPITRDVTGEEVYATIFAIEESPIERGVIWVGANDGPVHVTRDAGKSWHKVTPNMPPGGRVQNIDPSPHRRGSAYVAVHRRLWNDPKPYVYRTDDYGKSWTLLTPGDNGIPSDHLIRVVREDPVRQGLLFAGGQFGFFLSFDNGRRWQRFQQNLPVTPVTDIRIHQNDLIVSTMGRSFWIMDDMTPLRQITDSAAGISRGQSDVLTMASSAFLFVPKPAYRTRHGAMPASLTTPELPGPGAIVNYYFREAPAAPVTLEIVNSAGEVMRTIRSAGTGGAGAGAGRGQPPAEPPPAQAGRGGGRGGRGGRGAGGGAAPLTAGAGMQRYVWDMQSDQGLTVPPGQYVLRLTSGSWQQQQPLEIRLDPRLVADGVTATDLDLQYRFNVRLRAAIADARALTTAIESAAAAGGANRDALERIRGALVDAGGAYPRPMLNRQLSEISRVANAADARPNNGTVLRLDDVEKELAALKAEAARYGVK
jgi:photosystem II stability/assembly factor-like uncharacterized protein